MYLQDFQEQTLYEPAQTPGFVAWVSAFPFQDGSMGLSFDETTSEADPDYRVPRLEFAEAAGIPVSYGTIEAGNPGRRSFRVFLRSSDGIHFEQTGRCPRKEGCFACAGFSSGRIVGLDVPRRNEDGTGWCDALIVRESTDGGNHFHEVKRLFPGTAPYLWRVRRLRDGQMIVLGSFYGTPWGEGQARTTRNTMLPDETYTGKIQTFFLTSRDGLSYSEPHYILPGIGAHEYDVAELPGGRLLFVAGDVQGTPVGRQIVTPGPDGWINGPLLPIREGAPQDPDSDPQGGFVPETLVYDEKTACLIGFRRGKGYAISNDEGENWVQAAPEKSFSLLYQPMMVSFPDGRIALFGHIGGDNAFGEKVMSIRLQTFTLKDTEKLPKKPHLTLRRLLSEDGNHYENAFEARLTFSKAAEEGSAPAPQTGGEKEIPAAGERIRFRFQPFWKEDGSVNTLPQEEARYQEEVLTDGSGCAIARAQAFDHRADVHLSYTADAVFAGDEEKKLRPARSASQTCLALRPYRNCPYPYDGYMAEGVLYLSPSFQKDFPKAMASLEKFLSSFPEGPLPPDVTGPEACERLAKSGVLRARPDGQYDFVSCVHSPGKNGRPVHVRAMLDGDQYDTIS